MVSIKNIHTGQAEHYYARDDYYSKSHGQWQGKSAEVLGLQGEVQAEDFQHLLRGQDRQGNALVPLGPSGHRAGVDLTFSAPKSISILSHVVGNELVKEAHEQAVKATLSHIEERFAQARETRSGETKKIETGNFVIASFSHHTSRELDPQLHTHTVIMNLTLQEPGRWKALSNESLYTNKMYIGQHYRNELAVNLKELGYAVNADHRGLFEISGIDQILLDHFSQRSEQIAEKVSELKASNRYPNASDQKLREIAALGSRVAKRAVDMESVQGAWNNRLKDLGYEIHQVARSAQKEILKEPSRETNEYIQLATRIVTENESVFSREQLLRSSGILALGEHRMKDLEQAFEKTSREDIIRLDSNTYTTKEMNRIERDILLKVREGWGKTTPLVDEKEVVELLQKHDYFTTGQAQAVKHILTSRDLVIGIQGDAGTGKTTALKVIKEQLGKEGVQVRGLSFTGKSAEEIDKNAGIASQTIDSFLSSAKINDVDGRQVWIVDEASMLGSRKMHTLLEKAEDTGNKVVLIGDIKQLRAIEAGRIFGKLQETKILRTVEMKETLRQQEQGYKDIIKDISARKIDAAFMKLENNNRLVEIAGREERLAAIARDFMEHPKRNTLIVTARNADRNELNIMVRDEIKAQNRLQGEEHSFTVREAKGVNGVARHFAQSYQPGDVIYTQKAGIVGRAGTEARVMEANSHDHTITVEIGNGAQHPIDLAEHGEHISVYNEKQQDFSMGDRIAFGKNDKALHIQNGVTATIKNIDDRGNITTVTDSGKVVSFNVARYQYFDIGYAVTDYKAQGQTSREVIYHARAQDANYNQFYTAITRGKDDVRVYTDTKYDLKEHARNEQLKTSTLDYRDIGDRDKETSATEPQVKEIREIENMDKGLDEHVYREIEKDSDMSREIEREIG